MIVTVTPNPSMDKAYVVPEFRPGKWFRASDVQTTAGGRGINVSLVLKQLGYDSVATGFIAGNTGEYIRGQLLESAITTNFTKVNGENRANLYVIDEVGGVETGLTDPGPHITSLEIEYFFKNLDRLLHRADSLLMGGGLPPSVPVDFFRKITERARYHNIRVFVDTFGPALDEVILAQPSVLKIDQRYMNSIDGIPLSSIDNLLLISKKIFDHGVDWVISSYFNNTNLFYTPKGVYTAEIPRRNVVSVFGANDSLMAGMIAARQEQMDVEETIRFAMACVLEDVQHFSKGVPSRTAVENSLSTVVINKIV